MIYSKKVFIYLLTSEISFLVKKKNFFFFEDNLNSLNLKINLFENIKKFISKSIFQNLFFINFFSLQLIKFPLFIDFTFNFQNFEKIFLFFYLLKNNFIIFNYKMYTFIKIFFSSYFLFSEIQNLKYFKYFSFIYFNKIFNLKSYIININ
jgi:hypothetical protein